MSNKDRILVGSGGQPSRMSTGGISRNAEIYKLVQTAIPSGEYDDDNGWYYVDVKIIGRYDKRTAKSVVASTQSTIRNATKKQHEGYRARLHTIPEDAENEKFARVWFKVVPK